jgi:tape measure domain-containing protein
VSVVANVAINVDSRNATAGLGNLQGQVGVTQRAFNGLIGTAAKLTAAFSGLQAIKFVFAQAAQIQTQTRSLEVLAGSADKARQIIKQLQDIGAVTPFTSSELIDSAKRLQAFGVATSKVVETTKRLADVSGATGAELSGIATAYGQVIAKGKLQGEELLQFQERGVALQQALIDQLGLTEQQFTKALSSGQISAAAVEQAIAKLTAAGGKYANGAVAQSDTLNGRLSTLQDSFQRLGQSIGANLEPVFKGLINLSIVIVEKFGGIITVLGSLTGAVYLFNAAMVKFAAINIATILAQIGGGLTTVVTGYTAAGAAVTATNLTVSASTVAFGALKVAMLALPFVAVVAGVALVIAKFREADEESTKFFNAQAEKVLEEAEKNLERAKANKKAKELATAKANQEQNIAAILRGQLSTIVSLTAQEQMRLNIAQTRVNNEQTIATAIYGALLKVNDLEMQRAQNAGDVQKQYQLQLQKAELVYRQSVLQIQSEIRKAELGALQVKIELEKLKAATLLKAAKGEVTQADYDALALQRQAIELAFQGVDAARQAAMYHMQGANAIHQKTVEMAAFNRTQAAGRASGGGGGGAIGNGGGGGGGAIGGGGGGTVTRVTSMGTTRSLGAATPQQLAIQLSAKGLSGDFTEQQAITTLDGLYEQRVQKYIDDRAAQGFGNISPTSVSERQLERTGFAEGGFVTRPTDAMVGEGGQPEYVIPASKMNDAVRRYSAGTRGEAVVSGAMSSGGANSTANYSSQQNAYYGGGTGASVNITTGPVIRMDNRDYVTMTDMQRGMAAAAGASQASMMRSMSRSYATRRSMGL